MITVLTNHFIIEIAELRIAKILNNISKEIYEIIFQLVMEKLEISTCSLGDKNLDELAIYVQTILVFIKTPHPSSLGRSVVYKNWSKVCIYLNKLVNQTCSIPLLDSCFSLTSFVLKDKVRFS